MKYVVYFKKIEKPKGMSYLWEDDDFEFAYREFSNEWVAKAYMKGMKQHLPDIKMTLKKEW